MAGMESPSERRSGSGTGGAGGPRFGLIGAAFILLYGATAARALSGYAGQALSPAAYALLAGFLLLSPTPHLPARRLPLYPDLYLGLQSLLVAALILLPPHPDFVAALYICLTIQAMALFPGRKGFGWTAAFSVAMVAALAVAFGPGEGLTYAPGQIAGCVLVALYMSAVRRAEDEKSRGQVLLAELQKAYGELEKHSARAREYAAVEERNRLARELHDSVTQKLFSMTLTAEAARLLQARDPARVAVLLVRLQDLARDSLAEMRALLQKLSSGTEAEGGLVPALRRHVEDRRRADGLEVELVVEGEPEPPGPVGEALFRVTQEALNNVVKHAGTGAARVVLRRSGGMVRLLVVDEGRGFRPAEAAGGAAGGGAAGGGAARLGLSGMRERVRAIGGSLTIESEPGMGTRVCVEVPEGKSDGG